MEAVRFPALGTTAVVIVVDPSQLRVARAVVQETIDAFDRSCSRFREDSELARVNSASGQAVPVGPLLIAAVRAAVRAARITDGDVDPTVGGALIALGYDRDFDQLASGVGTVKVAAVPGWRAIELDRDASGIRVPRGVKLDLGATAKALAADRAAVAASGAAGCGVLVSLGGDIAVAGAAPDPGWRVRVTDDHRTGPEAPGQWITMHTGGLATSSTTTRAWRTGCTTVHHLIDPSTGSSVVSPVRTASVAAGTCLDANIASTTAILRGERAAAWLRGQRLPSRLVTVEGRARHLAGWPSEGDDLG